jgi:DNA polymerase III delta subunit
VVIDIKPKAAEAKALTANAEQYEEIARTEKAAERFNTFQLADALLHRDRKALWVLLVRARAAGIAPEEIAGVLFWQLKTLRLAETTKHARDAGVKDFPYNKAKRALPNFKSGEIAALLGELLALYHAGHAGEDMNIGLERFVLKSA